MMEMIHAMGIAGCSKIGDPSYMDGGGDRKEEKIPQVKSSIAVVQSSCTVTTVLSSIKESVSLAEDRAIRQMKAIHCKENAFLDAVTFMEMESRFLDDWERNDKESPLQGSIYHKVLEDFLSGMKKSLSLAEDRAIRQMKAVDREEEAFFCSVTSVEMQSRILDDWKRYCQESPLQGADHKLLADSHRISHEYHKMLEDSRSGTKEAMSIAREKMKALDCAKKDAHNAKTVLKLLDDAERNSQELGVGYASTSE